MADDPHHIRPVSAGRRLFLRTLAQVTRIWRFPGTERLVRRMLSPDRHDGHFHMRLPYEGYQIQVNTGSFLEWSVFFFGGYEPEVAHLIRRWLSPGAVGIDVGANVGLFTLVMARAVGPHGRVIAAEPHPAIQKRLVEHLRMNRIQQVIPLQMALGSAPDQMVLHTYQADAPNQGGSTLVPVDSDDARTVAIQVTVQTLDAVAKQQNLQRLDLIKIDSEGWDFHVLEGAQETIRRFKPRIIFEYTVGGWGNAHVSFKEVKDWMSALGYRLFLIRQRRFLPLLGWPGVRLTAATDYFPASCNIAALPTREPAP